VLIIYLAYTPVYKAVKYYPSTSYMGLKLSLESTNQTRIENLAVGAKYTAAFKSKHTCMKMQTHSLIYLTVLLLQNDIETNPGPKFPCGVCAKPVTNGQRAVSCDGCEAWFHIGCQGMSVQAYDACIGKSFSWSCLTCGLPNISSSYFTSTVSTANSYSTLDDSLGIPLRTSTPVKQGPARRCQNLVTLLNINCQSIAGKKAEFQHKIDETKPDIICATETWLTSDHADGEIGDAESFQEKYNIYRKDRTTRKGGGVLLAIKKTIHSEQAAELDTECESVWARLKKPNGKLLYVSAFYRPHVTDRDSIHELRKSMELIPQSATIIVAGDLNYPDIDWSTNEIRSLGSTHAANHLELIGLVDDYSLEQLVHEPTRGDNTLDLVLTNCPPICHDVRVQPGLSDHEAVLCHLDFRPIRNKTTQREIPIYSKAEWDKIGTKINSCYNHIVENSENMSADDIWRKFSTDLNEATKCHIPTRRSRGGKDKPWITCRLKRMIRKRDRLYRKQRKTTERHDKENYYEMKNLVQREMRKSYWTYVEGIITPTEDEDTQKTNKRFWGFIKNCGQGTRDIPGLKDEIPAEKQTPVDKANILNRQFQSVFSKPSPISLKSLCELQSTKVNNPKMTPITFTVAGIDKMLCELKIHKACGPDGIKPIILRNLHQTVAPILQILFQKCYDTGQTPDEWRKANVSPIYKKGDKTEPANYRPVSLTCIACKLMEHVVCSALMRHVEGHRLLHPNQHGFRQARSCETQLLDFTHSLLTCMHDGNQSDIVVMDFAKAFDTVPHNRLLLKLHRLGVDQQTVGWIASFLRDRSQRVVLGGETSEEVAVLSGVPQGSVLGPALFLCYINDLPDGLSSEVRLFADDTVLTKQICNQDDADSLQRDLDKLEKWSREWQMNFHPAKCHVLHITRNRKVIRSPYKLYDTYLEEKESTKYLGIHITTDLRWNKQVSAVKAKASQKLGFLRRNMRVRSPRLKAQLYSSIVRSTLEYSSTVWSPHEEKYVASLESVQRKAARWVLNRHQRTDSVSAMLTKLGWLKLAERRTLNRLAMLFKIQNCLAHVPHSFLTHSVHTRYTRHTNTHMLAPFAPRTDYYKFAFFPQTVSLWNTLPSSVLTAPSVDVFRARLQQMQAATAPAV